MEGYASRHYLVYSTVKNNTPSVALLCPLPLSSHWYYCTWLWIYQSSVLKKKKIILSCCNGICYCSTERETKASIENSTERKRDNHMQGLYDNDLKMLVFITNKCCNMLPGRAQNYNHATLANGEITEKIDQPQIFHTGHETEFCIIV